MNMLLWSRIFRRLLTVDESTLFLECTASEHSAANCSLSRVSSAVNWATRSCSCCRLSVSCCAMLRSTSSAARKLSTTSVSTPFGWSAPLFCSVALDLPQDMYHTHTHTCLTALFPGLPGWAGTRKVNQSGFYWSKRQWVAVASAGPYASLHLAPDR